MNHTALPPVEQKPQPIIQLDGELTQPIAVAPQRIKLVLGVSFALIISAEIMTDFLGIIPGVVFYTVLLVAFIGYPYLVHLPSVHRAFHALTLLPLLRMLSLVMPVPHTSPLLSYVLVGTPLLIVSLVTVRINRLNLLRINLTWSETAVQFLFGIIGIPLGLVAALVLKPPVEISASSSLGSNLLLWIVMTVFVIPTEEIIFRGLVQKSINSFFGFFSIVLCGILYGSMFIGTLSVGPVIFYSLCGMLFGLWVRFSDSLWGAITAHSVMNLVFIILISLH